VVISKGRGAILNAWRRRNKVSDVSAATGETTDSAGERRARATAPATIHVLAASQVGRIFFWFVMPVSSLMSCVAQLCDVRAQHARALKPFVACRDLIIVIPLYAWERIRVITINDKATDRDAKAVLR
jgi:hypothetical protein